MILEFAQTFFIVDLDRLLLVSDRLCLFMLFSYSSFFDICDGYMIDSDYPTGIP